MLFLFYFVAATAIGFAISQMRGVVFMENTICKEKFLEFYEMMKRIRLFEEEASTQFARGQVMGFVHLYIGEEAIATGVCANLISKDYITSTHRGHGHLIAKGAELNRMFAEICGRATGYCKGKGGSMHIADIGLGILGANGIVGGGFCVAAGAALASKLRGDDSVCVCFFGDGATNEGSFHEAMNIAAVWKLPVVFVCENNLYGMFSAQKNTMAIEDIADRAHAYGMPGVVADGNDIAETYKVAGKAIAQARNGEGPTLIEFKTYRHQGHFSADPGKYRDPEEIAKWTSPAKDPIARCEAYLLEKGYVTQDYFNEVTQKITADVRMARDFALNSPWPELSSAVEDVYTDIVEEAR
jgi:pyruvate dehydrogenase E1 component alpha subunit